VTLHRLSRRAKRRLLMLFTMTLLASVAAVSLRTIRTVQQQRLVDQARREGIAAYASGNLDLTLQKLSYVFEHEKNDLDVNMTFAEARARKPLPNAQHLLEAVDLYSTHCLKLLDASHSEPQNSDRRRHVLNRLLKIYGQLGLRHEILRTADQVLAIDLQSRDALGSKAEVLYLERRLDEAESIAQRLIELDPDNLDWRRLALDIRDARDVPHDALIEQCREWAREYAGDGRFHLLAASMLAESYQDDAARQEMRAAVLRGSDAPEILERSVSLLDLLNMRGEATQLIAAVQAKFPNQSWVREVSIRRSWHAGRYDQALDELAQADRDGIVSGPPLHRLKVLALIGADRSDEARVALAPLIQSPVSADGHSDTDHAWASAIAAALDPAASRWRDRVTSLENALALSTADPVLHHLAGGACADVGEHARALVAFKQAYELDPDWLAAGIVYADTLLTLGRLDEAYEVSRVVVSRAAEDQIAPVMLFARTYLALRQTGGGAQLVAADQDVLDELIRALQRIHDEFPSHAAAAGLLTEALVQNQDHERARQVIIAAIHSAGDNQSDHPIEPRFANVLLELASVSAKHQLQLEQPLLEQAQRIAGTTWPIAMAEARRLASNGDAGAGLVLLDQTLTQAGLSDAELRHAKCDRATYLLEISNPQSAEALEGLVNEYPRSPDVQRFVLAQTSIWSNMQLVAKAMANLKAVLGEDSSQVRLAEANFLLRHHAQNQAMLAKAIVQINGVLERSPDSLAGLSLLAEALVMGQHPNLYGAIDSLERAVSLYPAESSLVVRLIRLLQEAGNFEKAGQHLHRLAQLSEQQPQLHQAELQLLQAQGDFESALARASALVHESSPLPDQLILASIHQRAGHRQEAEEIYQRLLGAPNREPLAVAEAAEFYANTGRFELGLELIETLAPPGGQAARLQLVGAFHQRHGRSEEAGRLLLQAVQADPASAQARLELALHLISQRDHASAREHAEAGLALEPENRDLQAALAVANLGIPGADRQQAIRRLRKLGEGNDDLLATLVLLEQIPVRDGRSAPTDANLAAAHRLVEAHGRFLPAWMLAMSLHIEAGRVSEAITLARGAVSRFPAKSEPAQWATQLLMQSRRWSEALVEAQEWRRRNLSEPLQADVVIAAILLELDRADDALQQLAASAEQIQSERERWPQRLELWLKVLAQSGQYERAAAIIKPLLPVEPRWRAAWMEIAGKLGPEEAYDALSMLEPQVIEPQEHLILAGHWTLLGRWTGRDDLLDRADHLAIRASDKAGFASKSLAARGAVAEARGDLDTAETFYREALKLDSNDPLALNNLAYVLAQSPQRCPEALSMVKTALEREPGQPDLLDTYGQVLLGLDRPEEAEKVLREALAVRPDDLGIALNLVEALVRQERVDDAGEMLTDLRRRIRAIPRPDPRHQDRLENLRERLQSIQTVARNT
jgi:tetratricopeptide (TPR) repeat protein